MSIDLSQFDLPELLALQKRVDAEIPARQKQEKVRALSDLQKLAAERGFSLDELLGAAAPVDGRKNRPPVEAKYRNPADASQTWTGRGRQPAWVKAHVDAGGAVTDFLI